jgi:hypothetical protein
MLTTYKNRVIDMIDQEFEDFNKENDKPKGLKTIIDFSTTDINYEGTSISTNIKPKFKQKIKSSVYIKKDNKNNNLF